MRRLDEAGIDRGVVMTIVDAPGGQPGRDRADRRRAAAPTRTGSRRSPASTPGTATSRSRCSSGRSSSASRGSSSTRSRRSRTRRREETLRLIRVAAEHGAPTLFHCGDEPMATPLAIAQAAAACPEATIILGHMGGYFHVDEAIEVAERARERRARDVGDALSGEDPRGGRADRRRARPLRERRAGVLAADRGREGPARRARPRRRAARVRRQRPAASWTPSDDRRQPHLRRRLDLRPLDERRGRPRGAGRRRASTTRSSARRSRRGYHLGPANDAVAEAVARRRRTGSRASPGSTLCSATTRAPSSSARSTSSGCAGSSCTRGRRRSAITDHRVDAVVEVARRRGVPVIVAAGYPLLSEALQVGDARAPLPGCRVRRDERHPDSTSPASARRTPSSRSQATATCSCRRPASTGRTSSRASSDASERGRVLYASAYPLLDPRLEIRRVQWAAFSETESEALLGGNAATVFGLR